MEANNTIERVNVSAFKNLEKLLPGFDTETGDLTLQVVFDGFTELNLTVQSLTIILATITRDHPELSDHIPIILNLATRLIQISSSEFLDGLAKPKYSGRENMVSVNNILKLK